MYSEFERKFSPLTMGKITEFSKEGQVEKQATGADLLAWLESEHFHQKVVGKKTITTPHAESLMEHSRMVADKCYTYAVEHDFDNPWKFYLAGFFHDVGKPGATYVQGKHLSMKGHGLVGGAIIENMCSDELLLEFGLSHDDWADISTAADIHMCGYHPRFPLDGIHVDTYALLNEEVKELIKALRIGDSTSIVKRPDDNYNRDESDALCHNTQQQFEEAIDRPYQSNQFCAKHGLDQGVMIVLQGMSGMGKSTVADEIKTELMVVYDITTVGIFSRDLYMVNASRRRQGLPLFTPDDDISGEDYKNAYDYYIANGKAWAEEINRSMKKDIGDMLYNGGVAIVDTMATAFPRASADIIPSNAEKALRINIWCHRNKPFLITETTSRRGLSVEEQLSINRKQDMTNPLGHGLEWGNLVSMTEDIEPKLKNPCRPHISISYGWSGIKRDYLKRLTYITANAIINHNWLVPRAPEVDKTHNMTLWELIQMLNKRGGQTMVREFFGRNFYSVKTEDYDDFYTVVVKYLDGINRIWKPRWARESRGRGYAVMANGSVLCLKDSLIRGSEFLTAKHYEQGIEESQDLESRADVDILDHWQQTSMKQFSNASNIIQKGVYTAKVDGAQGNITNYPKGSNAYHVMKEVVARNKAFYIEDDHQLYVPSTSGCLFVPEAMEWYVLTSLAGAIDHQLFEKSSRHTNWNNITFQTKLMEKIIKPIMEATPGPIVKTATFEWVCANRTTFRGQTHTELAISYPTSDCYFLGITINGCYHPHYEYPELTLRQPNWRKMETAGDVFKMMGDMTAVINGEKSEDDFCSTWFPGQVASFHPEGGCFLDHHNCDAEFGPTYAKIKHPDYYIFHKFEKYGEARVLAYPQSVEKYYPVVGKLRHFRENTLQILIDYLALMTDVMKGDISADSETYAGLNPKAKARFDSYIAQPNDTDLHTICKMVVNTMSDSLREKVIAQTAEMFHIKREDCDDRIFGFAKGILMTCQPWANNIETVAKKEVETHSPKIDELFKLVMFN